MTKVPLGFDRNVRALGMQRHTIWLQAALVLVLASSACTSKKESQNVQAPVIETPVQAQVPETATPPDVATATPPDVATATPPDVATATPDVVVAVDKPTPPIKLPYTVEQLKKGLTVGTTYSLSTYVEGEEGYTTKIKVLKANDKQLTLRYRVPGQKPNSRTTTWQEFAQVFEKGAKVEFEGTETIDTPIGDLECLVYRVQDLDPDEGEGVYSNYVYKYAFAKKHPGPAVYVEVTYDEVVTEETTITRFKQK